MVIAQWISQQGFRVYEAFEEFQRNKKKNGNALNDPKVVLSLKLFT